jgi:uncharacterized protein with von Willebrand factor type A (vWA) domain
MSEPLDVLLEFVGALRTAGLTIGTDRIVNAAAALESLPAAPYWPLRVTLCAGPPDLEVFDAVWRAWQANAAEPVEVVAAIETETPGAEPVTEATGGEPAGGDTRAGASGHDELTHRDVRELTAAELAEIQSLIALLAPRTRLRPSMRRAPARTGRIDAARTARSMLRHAGEPARIVRTRRTSRPRRLLMLLDISGSMATYSDVMLRFAHAAVTAARPTTEIFTVGTRWTRLTPLLADRDADAAMRAVAGLETDWEGGTKLGPALRDFLRHWGGRTTVRSAIVVISSDGMEFGDLRVLPRQVARLSRLGHTLIWVNPKQARENYVPLNPALKESLGYATERLSGHSLASLRELAEVIAR